MAAKIWAHKGASAYAPENTIPAFKKAIEMGADGIELDVHMSKDGKLVVIHDAKVDRTSNGTGYVFDMTCQELKKLDFSNGMEEFKGTRIPTLREVYGLLKDTDLKINVEIKSEEKVYIGIWKELIKLEREMGMQGRIIYSSFNHYVLMSLLETDPDAEIGVLYNCGLVDPWSYAQYVGAKAVHPYYRTLETPGVIEECVEHGIDINAWTCDDEKIIRKLSDAGVHAIITNKPDVAKNALK